jgi:hypothetical protein
MKVYKENNNHLGWKEVIVDDNECMYSVSLYKGKLISIAEISPISGRVDPDSELYHMIQSCVGNYLNTEIGS